MKKIRIPGIPWFPIAAVTKAEQAAARAKGERARGMLSSAVGRMASLYAFLVGFIAQGRFEEARWIDTMAVAVRDGVIRFLYNPIFVCACSLDQLAGVLHHEVNHILFGHVIADPSRYPDREAWEIACEVTVNEWVPEPLPGSPILLEQFPQLPPDEDTATRYERLVNDPSWRKQHAGRLAGGGGILGLVDDHDAWREDGVEDSLEELAIQVAVQEAFKALTPHQRGLLPLPQRRIIERVARGESPGDRREEIGSLDAGAARIDWRRILERHLSAALEVQPTYSRPPRRFPHLIGRVPGRLRRPMRSRVLAAIDTSGSIGANDLAAIATELERLARDHEVTVVECDAAIQAAYRYRARIASAGGRGGTDLRPPLREKFLARHRPDAVVYFTDGAGPAPARPPSVPVFWCLTAAGRRPASWGQEVRMV